MEHKNIIHGNYADDTSHEITKHLRKTVWRLAYGHSITRDYNGRYLQLVKYMLNLYCSIYSLKVTILGDKMTMTMIFRIKRKKDEIDED